jgi:hypothetical protein
VPKLGNGKATLLNVWVQWYYTYDDNLWTTVCGHNKFLTPGDYTHACNLLLSRDTSFRLSQINQRPPRLTYLLVLPIYDMDFYGLFCILELPAFPFTHCSNENHGIHNFLSIIKRSSTRKDMEIYSHNFSNTSYEDTMIATMWRGCQSTPGYSASLFKFLLALSSLVPIWSFTCTTQIRDK